MQRRPIPKQQSQPDRKKRIILAVLLVLMLSATATWAMWSREDPQMAKVRDMAAEMEDLPRDQRRDQYRKMRDETEKLTEEQRDVFRDEMRQRWEARESKQMKDFFDLPREEQIAKLDERIDRMQEWQKRREGEGEGERRRGRRGGRGRGGRGGQSFGQNSDGSNAAVDRRNSRLDRGSADGRAQRTEYFRMMTARMKERGVSFPSRGRRG
jgi:hypothetical protein